QDDAEAVKWFRKAADQEFADAQDWLGICYYGGVGVALDDKKAVDWFRKAAHQGHAGAQTRLGECYYDGRGVLQDREKAVAWFRKAAVQGDPQACVALGSASLGLPSAGLAGFWAFVEGSPTISGLALLSGSFDPSGDSSKSRLAVDWFRKGAEHGYADADAFLAICYTFGIGVAQDEVEAYAWALVARYHGVADDFDLRTELQNGILFAPLSTSDVTQGEQRSQELLKAIEEK
ncbi:sel1 repeat family protein, partial [Planctomycetota bacterium]|nr:sel1 repeat family protein [Planctomycetota bacterium]